MGADPAEVVLERLLEQAEREGLVGAEGLRGAIPHSEGFARLVPPGRFVADLGSGAGLPGLVVALRVPGCRVVLIEASTRRGDHLRRCVSALNLGEEVEIQLLPAEELGRDRARRGSFEVVTARGFGTPPWVAECAAGLLCVGGRLVVSEPAGSRGERWRGLDSTDLPLVLDRVVVDGEARGTYAVLVLDGTPPDDLPRRHSAASRDPLFDPGGCST